MYFSFINLKKKMDCLVILVIFCNLASEIVATDG